MSATVPPRRLLFALALLVGGCATEQPRARVADGAHSDDAPRGDAASVVDGALPDATRADGPPGDASPPADKTPPADAKATTPDTAPPPPGVAYKGVSTAMWAEISAQRATFGDPNDCQARVAAIPTTGTTLAPCGGDCIHTALGGAGAVILQGGTYTISKTIKLAGKALVGAPGADVVIDASGVDTAVDLGVGGMLSNVRVVDAENIGVQLRDDGLAYRVSVARTGYGPTSNNAGFGFSASGGAHNCIVSTEAFDGYNEDGASCSACYDGGNADGYAIKFDSSENTVIDGHAYRNSDDGYDFWEGKTVYVYFSSAFEAGKLVGRPNKDGNGIKLGRGSAVHYLYKCEAYDNKANGFDINGNTIPSVLVQCDAWGNGGKDYVGVANQ